MLCKFNKKEAMVNGGGSYSPTMMSPTKYYNNYSNHNHQQHNGGYHQMPMQNYYGRYGTSSTRNSSPNFNYPATYPRLRTTDIVCGFCKHRFYISKDLKATYSPLLLPCGHPSCSNCEILKPARPCSLCPDYPVDVEARKRLPYNLYVIGLVHTINSAPLPVEDMEINFHKPLSVVFHQTLEQDICKECDTFADRICKNCNLRYCQYCFKMIHKKALKDHESVPLTKNCFDFMPMCPMHENATEYHCNDCNFDGCSHCMVNLHNGHNTVAHAERNKECVMEFRAAVSKLQDTMLRVQQSQQNLSNKMVCSEAVKQAQTVENEITRHFIHLHGFLQNLEEQLRKSLQEPHNKSQRDMEDIRKTLDAHAERLTSACLTAARAEANIGRINLEKLTEKFLELADTPCHIVPMEEYKEEIRMKMDIQIFDHIKNHIQLCVPDLPRFHLVKTDELPQDYELEPLPVNETMNSSFKFSSQRDISSPGLSIHSGSTSPSFNEFTNIDGTSMEKGSNELIKMISFKNPTEFYVQRMSTVEMLEEIESDIAIYMESDPATPKEILINSLYVVYHSSKDKWCRGRVIDIVEGSNPTYEILFIDYGSVEKGLLINAIRCAQPQFNLTSGLALRCSLAEIAPNDGSDWDDKDLKVCQAMVDSCQLSMVVLHTNEPVYTVELIGLNRGNNKTTVFFREWLIDTKLAKPTSYYKLKRMNPLSTHQFYYEDIPIDKYTKVEISYIASPHCIYVKKLHDKDFQEKMQLFYKQYTDLEKHEDFTMKFPEYGNTVALKSGSIWVRGTITKIDEKNSEVEVFLVDIGSTQKVPYSHVRRLPSRFCKWNAQAIKVSLIHVKPINDEKWSTEVINYLKKHLESTVVKIFAFSKTKDTYDVCMYLLHNSTNVNANLISMNMAESTGKYSKHTTLSNDISTNKKGRKKTKNITSLKSITPSTPKQKKENSRPVEDIDPYKVRVLINKAVSPDLIYVSDYSNNSNYETMMESMQKFYKSRKGILQGPLNPDWIYCVYSRKDKKFCRAQLHEISASNPNVIKMTLVDLAEVEDITLDEIQPLDPQFVDIPKHQFKVRLAGIIPCGGSNVWQSSSCQKLQEIINDTGDIKFYITLIEDSGPQDPMAVDLFIRRNIAAGPTEPNRKEILSVARCLIEDGLALPIRGFVNNEGKELAIELKKKLQFDTSICNSSRITSDSNKTIVEEESILDENDNGLETNERKDSDVEEEQYKNILHESASLPPKVIDWIEPAHIEDSVFNANVTYVDYEGNVNFHPDTKEYKDTLEYISHTLYKNYENKSIKKYDYNWKEDDLCIAKYHSDKKWYRGKVTRVVNSKMLMVLFVDYGNIEECPIGFVKKRIILEKIPIQCTKANIEGIKPIGSVWKDSDLDIIHATTVSQQCRMKITSRPPNPWKVTIWVKPSECMDFVALPWYLKNKTAVKNIEIDISLYNQNDKVFEENCTSMEFIKNDTKQSKQLIILNNNEDSSESSNDEDDLSSSMESILSLKKYEDNLSVTLTNSELPAEVTLQSVPNYNLSTVVNINCSSSKNLSVINSQNSSSDEISENMLSGNSIYFNANGNGDFDTQSVRSEALLNDANIGNLVSSTPLNASVQDIDSEKDIEVIDFYKYELEVIDICMTCLISGETFAAQLLKTPSDEINSWIDKCTELQKEIQDCAEQQPIHKFESESACIAKYKDGLWYRAYIIREVVSNLGKGVHVEFVDLGNYMTIYDEISIRTTKKKWLQIPRMGFQFKLYNTKFDKTKSKKARGAVKSTLKRNNTFRAIIKKYKPLVELELFLDEDCKDFAFTSLHENELLTILNSSVD